MTTGAGRIRSLFDADNSARHNVMERARLCASLTKPWALPPLGQTADAELPQPFQSLGARGITNLEGKTLLALYPPDFLWFSLEPAAEIRHDPSVSAEQLQQIEQVLFLQSLILVAKLEASNLSGGDAAYRHRSGFRSKKRMSLSQLFITGDTLEQLTDDYRIKVYRRDQYTTLRDSCGDVLRHGVRERIDPLSLSTERIAAASLSESDLRRKSTTERMMDIDTGAQWQPWSRTWVIEQELNGHVINTSEEEVSPFFCTPFELVSGEHYGRGFVEQNLGDFTSLDTLSERMLDFAAVASRMHPFLDYSSPLQEDDFKKPTGTVFRGKVQGGVVQDVAFLLTNKLADFKVVYDTHQAIRKDLGLSMLIESEVAPSGEAGRSPVAWQTIVNQLDGALGGLYAPIADDQQLPLIRRMMHQLERDRLILPLPRDAVEVKALTGLAAIARQQKAARLLTFAGVVRELGDTAAAKLNTGVLMDVLARLQGIDEPGLVKSNEQMLEEQRAAMAAAARQEAASKAIDVAGNIIENNATPGQPRPAAA